MCVEAPPLKLGDPPKDRDLQRTLFLSNEKKKVSLKKNFKSSRASSKFICEKSRKNI
jgi:hypothetical protein